MSSQPPGRPRSTPIPGISDGDTVFGSPLPGNTGSVPQTPSEFAAGQRGGTTFPPGPMMGAGMPAPGSYAPPPGGFTGGPYGAGFPAGVPNYSVPKKGRSPLGCLLVALVFIGPAIGVGIGIWAFFKARDAVDQATDLSNSDLSDDDLEALGLPDSVETLWGPGAAQALMDAYTAELGDTLRLTEVLIYTDYAFATVQDPAAPTHIDEYGWRSGDVSSPDPQTNDPDLETKLFANTDVNWGLVNVLTEAAPTALGIEQGEVSHVIVSRNGFGSGVVVIRVYVTGPRDSGYLEADAMTGAVLASS